jgi:hypothetical protein
MRCRQGAGLSCGGLEETDMQNSPNMHAASAGQEDQNGMPLCTRCCSPNRVQCGQRKTSLGRWHSAHLDGEKVPQPRPRARPGPPTKHSAMQMPPLHHPQNIARRSSCCESCGCYGCCRCWRHSSDAAYCCSSGGERHDHSKLRACGESIGGRPRATRHAFLLHGPFASEPASEASSEASSEVRPKSL